MSKVRLIDADALFAEFENAKWYDNKDRDLVAEDILLDAPTVDAAGVLRCGECKKQFMPDCPMQFIEKQSQVFICQRDDDYCSYGEAAEAPEKEDKHE